MLVPVLDRVLSRGPFVRKLSSFVLGAGLAFALLGLAVAEAADEGPVEFMSRDDGVEGARLALSIPRPAWRALESGALRPEVRGFGPLAIEGRPELPVRRERIALPEGASLTIDAVRVTWEEGSLPGELPLASFGSVPTLEAQRDGFWPKEVALVVSQEGRLRNARFATLEIRPFQVDLETRRYRFARALEIDYRIEGASRIRSSSAGAGGESPLFERLAPRMLRGEVSFSESSPSLHKSSPLAELVESYPAFQFLVDREGLYRVTYAWIAANAPDLLAFLQSEDPRRLRLTSQGIEIPFRVEGEADGSFGPGDALVFYGEPLDGDPFAPSEWQRGDFTDVNVYRLDTADDPARVDDAPLFAPPTLGNVAPSFRETARREDDDRFQQQTPAKGVDHWYVDPFLLFGQTESIDQLVSTPGHVGGSVDVRVRMLGFDRLHQTQVRVDGTLVDTQDWDGIVEFTHDVPVDRSAVPLAATTTVSVSITNGRENDQAMLNWVEIDYDRAYAAESGQLIFTVADDADYEVRLQDFAGIPEVWEIGITEIGGAGLPVSRPRLVQGVASSGGLPAFDVIAGGAPRRFVAADANAYLELSGASRVRSDLQTASCPGGSLRGADCEGRWVAIGPAELLGGPELAALAARRDAQGFTPAIIDIQDIYDEFTHGIEDPEALRLFFDAVLPGGSHEWSTAPEAVVLIGDATYDYRNNYGHPEDRNLLSTAAFDFPSNETYRIYVSDLWFVTVRGDDDLPDALIGRVPAHDLTEAEGVFRKILDYEDVLPSESWTGKALLVSEAPENPSDALGNEFTLLHDQVYEDWFVGTPQSAQKIYEDEPWIVGCGAAAQDMNSRYETSVNAGAAVTSFLGHGSFRSWGRTCTFFETAPPAEQAEDDLNDIDPGTPLQFHIHANCITGAFAATSSTTSTNDNWYVFMEDFLLTEGKGAVGAIAPSHLAYSYLLEPILSPFYRSLLGREKERFAGALDLRVRESLEGLNLGVANRSLILFGDPLLTLALPAPEAPVIQSIEPDGDEALLVTWSGVAGVSDYRVYRSADPRGPYDLAGEVSGGQTSFRDTGLVNCRDYYYYVVSVDARGFESRWSNFNETCSTTQDPEDCKFGAPFDPNPPPPPLWSTGTGGAPPPVEDLQSGGRLRLTWQAVDPELDVERYVIRWGTTLGGPYPNEREVFASRQTETISGLEDGVEHYFVIASQTCSERGPFGEERSGVPHLVRGINPPAAIDDLMVFKAADADNGSTDGVDDVRLAWSPPGASVWGIDTSVSGYEVFGSSERADFPTNSSTRLASLPAGSTEWTHELQASTPPTWRYLVVAIDAEGLASASGADFPAPVRDLRVEREGNTLFFRWTAVGGGMNGAPGVAVSGYNLYGRPDVLPRSSTSVDNQRAFFPQGVPGSELLGSDALPGEVFFTYQLLSIDSHGTEAVW